MTHLKQAAYDAGVEHALASLGLEKTAVVPLAGAGLMTAGLMTAGRAAVMQAGRAALPYLARAGTSLMGMGRGALAAGKGVATAARGAAAAGQGMSGAARAGWGAFQTAAPGVAKGLQTAGNVAMHPVTQVGMTVAPMLKGQA